MRTRVLLVPDFLSWVLGTYAKQIARFGETCDYYFFSQQMAPWYPDVWLRLLDTVDLVHFLNQHDLEGFKLPNGLPRITTITHVVSWEELTHLTHAEAVLVIAREWQQFLLDRDVDGDRIFLQPIGVDVERFYPFHDRTECRARLGIRYDGPIVGYSAKGSSDHGGRKGVDVFLEALWLLAADGHDFGVMITGPGWDHMVDRVTALGIPAFYRPFVPESMMPTVYNALDVYVVTSRIEGGPAPLLESIACGVPVVTTPVGVVRDFFRDGVDALIVPKGSPTATAQAIARLLGSGTLRRQIADEALQTVRSQLTWDRSLAGIEQVYEKVGRARHRPATTIDRPSMNPAEQRSWAVEVDAFLWHRALYRQEHRREGLRGMAESSYRLGPFDGARLLARLSPMPSTVRGLPRRARTTLQGWRARA
jgi:glycosyltransferase involved in cell wall biosynthesis